MKIITWNLNGIRSTANKGNFFPLFKQYDPDIVCLQETKAMSEQLSDEIKEIPGYKSFFTWPEFKKGYSGVAIYTKEAPLDVSYGMGLSGVKKELDQEGRMITVEYDSFFLINCYFPNGGGGPERLAYKMAFYEAFLNHCLLLEKKKPVIFCGDVNTAHTEIDLARPKENKENTGFLPEERAWIDLVIQSGFIDAFRAKNPDQKDIYTYWDQKTRARLRNVGWRIDYFFLSQQLHNKEFSVQTVAEYEGSDHCPVFLDILL